MASVATSIDKRAPRPSIQPLLQNGDNLSRDGFERRYAAMPDGVKAELIDGVVHMPAAAVSFGGHGRPHFKVGGLLAIYEEATPGVFGFDNASVRLDVGSMPQPDLGLLIDPALGGTARVDPDDYVSGAPEFVLEVTASTVSYDLHQKSNAYRRNGVAEYVAWRTVDREFDHFTLTPTRKYRRVPPDAGVIRSIALPGLWIDTRALIDMDSTTAFARVREGLASPDHAAFVTELGRRRVAISGPPRP